MANPQLALTNLLPVLTQLQVKRHLNNAHYDELERIVLTFLTYNGQQIYDAMVDDEGAEQALAMATKFATEYLVYLNKMIRHTTEAVDRLRLAAALHVKNHGENNDKY